MKVRVISPHLDDAVWSASGILERHDATMVTICAGVPPKGIEPTPFDQRAGFDSAHKAMASRRKEDRLAAEVLGCSVKHLDLLDVGYSLGEQLDSAVRDELQIAKAHEQIPVGPLGLRHPDHQLIATAFRRGALDYGVSAWVYEELPYAYAWPEYLASAIQLARCAEHTITRLPTAAKEGAVGAYQSQLRGAHRDAIMAPERYHRLYGAEDL